MQLERLLLKVLEVEIYLASRSQSAIICSIQVDRCILNIIVRRVDTRRWREISYQVDLQASLLNVSLKINKHEKLLLLKTLNPYLA